MKKKKFLWYQNWTPETIPGSLKLMEAGWLNKEHTEQLLRNARRDEARQNKHIYIKGMRATLLALGFDKDWVEGYFYEKALEMYK